MSDKMKKNLYALKNKSFVPLTLAPALLIIVGFTYIPALYSFVLSLFKTKLFTAERFIGLEHLVTILFCHLHVLVLKDRRIIRP